MKKAYVIGKNASKSLSPTIFNYWFKKHNIEGEYSFREVDESSFNNIIPVILKEKDLCGLNITIPFKEKIIGYLNFFYYISTTYYSFKRSILLLKDVGFFSLYLKSLST